jgi:ubiquinone biosynthesis monooxygenase Coq7
MPAASPAARSSGRSYDLIDRLIAPLDQALRTLSGNQHSSRPYPPQNIADTVAESERRRVAALMRVNHAGEVAAQALYQGQALVARNEDTRAAMLDAGREEADHLAWCTQRLHELGGRTSRLDPLWYAGSFAIGALAGMAGDRVSRGFVAETEHQVVAHLEGHLRQLPGNDARTEAILQQMSEDEERHGRNAKLAGGSEMPSYVRRAMRLVARVMTTLAYRI